MIHAATHLPQSAGTVLRDQTVYIPIMRNSHGCEYIPEMPLSDCLRSALVADIACGQHENVVKVLAADLGNGDIWDASKEIATAVLGTCFDEFGEIGTHCRDFLESYLGVWRVMRVEAEAA